MNLLKRIAQALAARRASRRALREAGYSLTEILIVMAIISMLMGAAGFIGFRKLKESRIQQTRNLMVQLKSMYVQWQASPGNEGCPGRLGDITDNKKDPKDGWGRVFLFKCPSEHEEDIDIISLGEDGKEGTADDLHSWDEPAAKK
jgi:general secretion pathway protein G